MSGFYPVPATRTTGLLAQSRLLYQFHADQAAIQRLQSQLSTGRRIEAPSEDVPAAQRGQTLQRLLELKTQAQTNLRTSQAFLDATDSSLSSVSQLLSDIRAAAVEAASDTSSPTTRQAAATEVRRAIEQLVATGNQEFRGRQLFAGSRVTDAPFAVVGPGVAYRGNEGELASYVDLDLPYATNAHGAAVFGTFSSEVTGTVDLDPRLTAETPLADLHGGRGVVPGSLRLSDGSASTVVDLSSAATIGDVARLLAANPPPGRTLTVQITATGLTLDLDDAGGGSLSIKEMPGGTTALDLRILAPLGVGTGPFAGGDLDPGVQLTTRLADLQTAAPLDLAAGLQIASGGQTYTIDTSAAETVEDLLNAIQRSPAQALAEIDPAGDRLRVRSRLSGVDFSIGENGGTLATQLGLRSLTTSTTLAQLNHGRGVAVSTTGGADFTIERRDGVTLSIDVASAATVGDVLQLINNHAANLNPATRVEARLAAFGNGIELFDGNTLGTGTLTVRPQFGSAAAHDLGLVPRGAASAAGVSSAAGDTLTGADVNPQEVSGVFNSLLRLQNALTTFDRPELERAVALLDEDFDRVTFARGEIGARGRTLERVQTQLDDEEILLKSNLADEIETDLPDTISQLAARQAALEASLRLAAQVFQTSLLNYL